MASVASRTDHTAIVERVVEAYNSCDFETYASFLTEDVYFCHHNRSPEYRGRAEVIAMLQEEASTMFSDRTLQSAKRIVQVDDLVFREQWWTGTAKADLPGVSLAKGDTISLELCSVYVFSGPRIAEYHEYG